MFGKFQAPCDIYDQQSFISIWSIGGSFGHIGKKSANHTTMDQFKNFQLFLTQNPNSNGVRFIKKCQLVYLMPHFVGRFGHIGGSANQPPDCEKKIGGTKSQSDTTSTPYYLFILSRSLLYFKVYRVTC